MKASAMYYDSYDSDSDQFQTIYIFSSIIGCIFWITVIYCCIRGCRKTAENPPVVQVIQQGEQQPQIHYIIHQDAVGADGRPLPAVGADGQPIAYQQVQSGQFVPVTAYQPPAAVAVVAQCTPTKEPVSSQNIV